MFIKRFAAAILALAVFLIQPLSSFPEAETFASSVSPDISITDSSKKTLGAIAWLGDDKYAAPGESVTLNFEVYDPYGIGLTISDAEFAIIPMPGMGENGEVLPAIKNYNIQASTHSPAYDADIIRDHENNEYSFSRGRNNPISAPDGKKVISIKVDLPYNIPVGRYEFDLVITKIIGEGGLDVTQYVIDFDAAITVKYYYPPETPTESAYAVLPKNYGFYLSDDDGKKYGGFRKEQLEEIQVNTTSEYSSGEIYEDSWGYSDIKDRLVFIDGNGTLNPSPMSVYDGRSGCKYDHDIRVGYIGVSGNVIPLVDEQGNPLYITAYIGVKGDVNLSNAVNANDASSVFHYYTMLDVAYSTDEVQLSSSSLVYSPTDILDNFAAFLGDIDSHGSLENNWKLMKSERTLNSEDCNAILNDYMYALSNSIGHLKMPDTSFDTEDSPIKPKLSLNAEYLPDTGKIKVTIDIDDAERKYAAFGIRLNYDERLVPSDPERLMQRDDATNEMLCASILNAEKDQIIFAGAGSKSRGKNGTLGSIEFDLPENFSSSDEFTFSLTCEGGEVFGNINDNEENKLMRAYFFKQFPISKTLKLSGGNDPLYGDATDDGKVDIGDAVLIMQAVANPDKYDVGGSDPDAMTEQGKINADCYKPGSGVTPMDALSIQKLLLRSINSLPEN